MRTNGFFAPLGGPRFYMMMLGVSVILRFVPLTYSTFTIKSTTVYLSCGKSHKTRLLPAGRCCPAA